MRLRWRKAQKTELLIVIESTSPCHEWAANFTAKAQQAGADGRKIIHFGKCLEWANNNLEQAKVLFEEYRSKASIIVLPLLEPRLHKHYLRCISEHPRKLADDPRTIVVFDLTNVTECGDPEIKGFQVTQMAVEGVTDSLRSDFGNERVVCVNDATSGLGALFRSHAA